MTINRRLAVLIGIVGIAGTPSCSAPTDQSASGEAALDSSTTNADRNIRPDDQAISGTGVRGELNSQAEVNAAFSAAFGKRSPARVVVDDRVVVFEPGSLHEIAGRTILISKGSDPDGCYVCQGMLAVHYLERNSEGYRVTGRWLDGGGTHFAGEPPPYYLTSNLTDDPLLYTENSTSHGPFCGWATLYRFSPNGPEEVAQVPTSYFDDGEGHETRGKIANVRKGQAFDVVFSGHAKGADHYIWENGRPKLVSGRSNIPTCD